LTIWFRLAKVAVATYIVLPSFVVAGYGFPASFAVAAYDCGGGLNRPPIPKVVASWGHWEATTLLTMVGLGGAGSVSVFNNEFEWIVSIALERQKMSSLITQKEATLGEISIPLRERAFGSKKNLARSNLTKIKGFQKLKNNYCPTYPNSWRHADAIIGFQDKWDRS
jgi:hypothetical protein